MIKSKIKKIFNILIFLILINPSVSFSDEVENLLKEIQDVQEKFEKIKDPISKEAKIIDEAIKELGKATDFISNSIGDNNNNIIKGLEFINRSLGEISNKIPKEAMSDMSNLDMTKLDENNLKEITKITKGMNKNKKKKTNDIINDLIELDSSGLKTFEIIKNLNTIGIDTMEINIDLEIFKQNTLLSKKELAESYKGSLLTSTDNEIITDKEIKGKLVDLENIYINNNLEIQSKKAALTSLNYQLDPINLEISKLKDRKDKLTSQYNLQLSKLDLQNLTLDEIEKNKNLTTKLENELKKLVKDMEAASLKSSNLKKEITSVSTGLNQDISLANSINHNINKLNKDKFDIQNKLSLKQNELNNIKNKNTELTSADNIQALQLKVKTSKNLQQQLDDVEKELINKNTLLIQKRSEISQLNKEINPLDLEINTLSNKKNELIIKYNQELENLTTSVNNEEIIVSKALADNLTKEINTASSQIQNIENSKLDIQNNLSKLNNELKIETNTASELSAGLISLNKDLSNIQEGLESKEIEISRIKELPNSLTQQNQVLEKQLQNVSLERDFIQTQFAKSIDKEVEAVEYFYPLLDKMSADEIDFAMEEVGVLLDGDPRKANAFDIRKYGKLAGLSQSEIQTGINAIQNDDWDTTKKVYKNIIGKMSKNPDYVVNIPSEAELNVMIAEDKALLQAVEIVKKGDQIKQQVDSIINEKTKSYQPLVGLNKTTLQYAVLSKGSLEAELVNKEFDKIVNNDTDLKSLIKTFEVKQKQLKDIQVFQELKTKEINNAIKPLQDQVANTYAQLNDINLNYSLKSLEKTTYINSIGGYASLYRDKGNSNYGDWVKNIGQLDQELYDIRSKSQEKLTEAQNISSEIYKIQLDNSTSQTDINNWINLQRDVGNLALEKSRKVGTATEQARSNVIAMVDDAKSNIQKITNEEIAKNPDYNYVEKVNKILDEISSFGVGQRKNATEAITGIGNLNIWAGGSLVDVGDKTAALRAALDSDPNRYEAYMTAVDKIKDIGKESSFKGPYWEMTNVKLALVVQSKLEGNMDYVYVSESDRIQLNSTERAEIEKELTSFLGNNNPKLNALNKHSEALKSQLDYNNVQLTNLNSSVSKLESELNSIKSNEQQIKSQITQINSDLSSKKNIISEKQSSLQNLQNELNPFTSEINNLEQKRQNLNLEVEKQLSIIIDKVNNSEKVTANANKIKDELNKELNEIDNKLNGLKSNSETLKVNISSLNSDIKNLESETPELSNQLTKLNRDLNQFTGIEGEFAALTNAKKTQIENIDFEVAKLENEIKDLKSTEDVLNSQITNLSSQLEVNLNTIDQKKLSISNLENQLTPINSSISNLETKQKDLATEFDNGIELIASQLQSKDNQTLAIQKLKDEFDQRNLEINNEIVSFETQANKISSSVKDLNDEISTIEVNSPEIETQITKLNQDLKDFTNIKADLALSEADKLFEIEDKIKKQLVEKIAKIKNKSIITINDDLNTYRLVDTSLLLDNSGKFKSPLGTVTVNGSVYTAGAVQANQLYSFKQINESGDLKINFSKEAANLIEKTGKLSGGDQLYGSNYGSGLGSWVLVDAKNGKQMSNPNTGHSGSIVCDGFTCGPTGSNGQKAAAFGGIYVLENLASLDGKVAGSCASGNCSFNLEQEQINNYMITALNVEGLTDVYTGHVNGVPTFAKIDSKGKVIQKNIKVANGKVFTEEEFEIFSKNSDVLVSTNNSKIKSSIVNMKERTGNQTRDYLERVDRASSEAALANTNAMIASSDIEKGIINTNTAAASYSKLRSLQTTQGVVTDIANNLQQDAEEAAQAAALNATQANKTVAAAAATAAAEARVVAEAAASSARAAAEDAAKQVASIAQATAAQAARAAAAATEEVKSAAQSAVDEAGIDYGLDNVQSLIAEIQAATGQDLSSIAQDVVDEYRNTAARKDRKDSLFKDDQGYYWSRSEVNEGDNVEWKTINGQRRACQGSCAAEE